MEQNRQNDAGSGSAENKGQSRDAQQHPQSGNIPSKEEMKQALGADAERLGSLQDTGAFSGRDDLAGGSGDDMETQSTGQGTDR